MNLNELSFDVIRYGAVYLFLITALMSVAVLIIVDLLNGKRFRYALPFSNTVIVLLISYIRCQSDDALADMIWQVPLSLDFILYPLLPVFSWLCGMFHSRVVCPFILFTVFGGCQYYCVGRIIDF